MTLATFSDVMGWLLPISLGILLGVFLATRKNKGEKEQIIVLDAEEFRKNMRKGQLIDIRPEEKYREKRINGSRNFPKKAIFSSLHQIRDDQPLFIYDDRQRGLVARVAKKLLKKGYRPVYVLKGGLEEWPYPVKKN